MKAQSIRVVNFRSIRDIEIDFADYSMLAGPNNAGKSNLLAAIRVFYEKGIKYDDSRDFPHFAKPDEESWIEIQYKPSKEELEDLKDEYRLSDGCFRVRKYLKTKAVDDDGKPKTGIYAYVDGKLSSSRFYGARNVQQGKFGDIVYIPAAGKLDDHTKLTGPSPLRDLLSTVLKEVLASSQAYQRLVEAFSDFGGRLKQETTPDGRSLAKLERDVSDAIEDWGLEFELLINSIPAEDVVKSLVGFQVVDGDVGRGQDPASYGHGFQRHLIFTLIRLAASYEPAAPPPKRKEFTPNLSWILFEEPEAFLHPPQMALLDKSLRAFSSRPGHQVTISTHSPQFASLHMEDLPAFIRLSRGSAETIAGQVRGAELASFLATNQACLDDLRAAGIDVTAEDETAEMESIKYALWLNPIRAAAFFAERVLLVEGASEFGLIGYLLGIGKLVTPSRGVAVLDTMGMYNTHRFMNLFGRLRIPHCVLYDREESSARNKAMERALLAARNGFTRGIATLDRSLEAELGLPAPGRADRKPQHAMWHLKQKKIEEARLQAFCGKIQALIDA